MGIKELLIFRPINDNDEQGNIALGISHKQTELYATLFKLEKHFGSTSKSGPTNFVGQILCLSTIGPPLLDANYPMKFVELRDGENVAYSHQQ